MDSRTIDVETNSVLLKLPDNFTYYQYDDFQPVDPKGRQPMRGKKVKLFHTLQNKVAPAIFNPRMIYDTQKLAYCPVQLSFNGNTSGSFYVHLDHDQVTEQTRGAYRVILNPTAGEVIRRSDLNELLVPAANTVQGLAPRVRGEKAKNILQLIVRQGPNLRYQTNNGRAYFSGVRGETRDVEDTKRGIELWRGIFLTVRPALQRMILTVDTCATAVFRGGRLIDFCLEYMKYTNPRQLDLAERAPDFKKLEKILSRVKVTVQTDRADRKSRPKIIRGLVPHAGRYEFAKDGNPTTVERYFLETYNVRLQFPNIIGVSFERKGSDRQTILPAELCMVVPGQICHRIPDDLRANMVKFSAMKPGDRKRRIENEVNDYIRSEYLAESKLAVERQLIKVQGKHLLAPRVVYGNGPIEPRPDGSWNVLRRQLFEVRELSSWGVVNACTTQVSQQQCKECMLGLMNCCKALGMRVSPPFEMVETNPFNVEKGLEDLLKIAQQNPQCDPKRFIIIVLLEQDAGPTRTRVKYWGDVQRGVMTQCLRYGKFNTNSNQYWNNVAIKLNARLGGTNSWASSAFWEAVMNQLGIFMIMGADVGHPSPGTQKPSVTSLVYSWDRYATKYAAMTGIQNPRQEIIENFRGYVKKAMNNFVQANNNPPAAIFFFRDGVSEGEYQTVSKHERDELQAAIDDLWREHQVKAPKPRLTFVIVTKRHHSVFFPGRSNNPKDNCPPGMVVENGVTTPLLQNFYLQSHTAIQGTSRSSHYVVLQDDNFNYDLHRLQHLCYHLCHVYAKATRSVSIPAPVYYADLVCSRLMFHLNPTAHLPSDDGASVTSGGDNEFDMSAWQGAFQKLNQSLSPRMYFL